MKKCILLVAMLALEMVPVVNASDSELVVAEPGVGEREHDDRRALLIAAANSGEDSEIKFPVEIVTPEDARIKRELENGCCYTFWCEDCCTKEGLLECLGACLSGPRDDSSFSGVGMMGGHHSGGCHGGGDGGACHG